MVSGQFHALATPRKRAPGTHYIGSWVDTRVELEAVENLALLGIEP
jgi:hypothetical protein